MLVTLKVFLGDDVRRFAFQPAWASSLVELRAFLASTLGPREPWILKYRDEDGDLISILTQGELLMSLPFASPEGVLRLWIVEKDPVPTAPMVSTAPAAAAAAAAAATTTATTTTAAAAPETQPLEAPGTLPSWRQHRAQWKADKARFKESRRRGEPAPVDAATLAASKYQWKLDKAQWRQHTTSPIKMAKVPKWTMARLVNHVTLPDGVVVAPNACMHKVWRLRNDSTGFVWPAGCKLIPVGHDRPFDPATPLPVVPQAIPPGTEVDVGVDLVAPLFAGEYTTFWKMALPDESEKFGQRIRFQFHVRTATPAILSIDEGDDSSSSSSSSACVPAITPSLELARECCKSDESAKYSAQLKELHGMGFDNDTLNCKLLRKFDGKLIVVVDRLLRKRMKKSANANV